VQAVEGSTEPAGQAVFNPFGTIGVVVVQAPALPASAPLTIQPMEGAWALPVTTALVGFAFIGWIVRGMLQ
jgi:hypothetical protein